MKLRGVLDDPALEGWIIQPLPQNVEEIVVTVVLAPGGANTTVVELSALAEDLGFQVNFWNGHSGDDQASLSLRCGLYWRSSKPGISVYALSDVK